MKRLVATVAASLAVALTFAVIAQRASADPINAQGASVITAICGSEEVTVVVNGGAFAPGHVLDSTAVFVPTDLDVTVTFTPTGGTPEVEIVDVAKARQPADAVTCTIPASLNTFTFPFGTLVFSGTVAGFFTPRA